MRSTDFEERLWRCQEMAGAKDPVYRSAFNEIIMEAGGSIDISARTNRDLLDKLTAAGADDERRAWRDVGDSPMDARLGAFSELYADADPDQRQILRDSFDGEQLRELTHFVARAARLIEIADDPRWLRAGLAGACMQNGRYDFRDLIASLSILRYGAERAGIVIEPYFDEALGMSFLPDLTREAPPVREILLAVKSYPRRTLKHYVRKFGPPEWRDEVKPWWRFW